MGLNKEQLQLVKIRREERLKAARAARPIDVVLSEIGQYLDQKAGELGAFTGRI